ncbi:endonuclease domain-containing protein [Mesoaciditoga lauensis]|uniref:endonuclease domain-containing protein n=2 Tax=Mesoaciditoga lauensis TaxID=1495039 RepID=UPI00056AAA12|nr:endonuclease domain-containing protein [Mesoaciditoga lauensis]
MVTKNKKLKVLARNLRKDMTLSETLLWQYLRKGQMLGYRFRRQEVIGNYIVDFFCRKLRLAIEIDGSSHDEKYELDMKRQREIESYGITVLRFSDKEVKENIESVLRGIEVWIRSSTLPAN